MSVTDLEWTPANHGSGDRRWFLTRRIRVGFEFDREWLWRSDGKLVRFASFATARKRADYLNARSREANG